MANEIGLYTASPPAAALGVFSGDAFANATTGTYTAISGDTLTKVRVFGRFGSGSGTIDVGLYTFSGGVPVTLVATYTLTFGGTDAWVESGTLSQALTAGTVYTLAIGNPVGGVFSASGVTATNGAANDDTTTLANPWVNARFDGHNFYVAGDITAGSSSVTKTPATAALAINPLAPTTNAFTYVAIRDTLINESGQPVASAANIRLMVWYGGQAIGAPDYSVNGLTTDPTGSISWSVATGTLTNGQAIFYVAQDSISYSNYTCGRVVPTYG